MNHQVRTRARIRPSERGLTLIELMIALLVASLMIGLVFSIYTRMSLAYRNQSDVSELQQTLRAAKERMVQEVRATGHLIPDGFNMLSGGATVLRKPVEVINDTLPLDVEFDADLIRVFYADTSAMAAVIAWDKTNNAMTVDDLDEFALNDLIVVVNPRPLTGISPGVAAIMHYDACLLQITGLVAPNKIEIKQGTSVFNSATNTHCNAALNVDPATRGNRPMVYRMGGRAYRIDPTTTLPERRAAGILQMSPSGGLIANDWQDIGIGFTDLQVAVRYFDDDATDQDGDGDALRDWYSSDVQPDLKTTSPDDDPVPLEMSVSLVLRTAHSVGLVPSRTTPRLTEGNVDHNAIGDSVELDLLNTPSASRPLQLRGNHIYRWFTARIDLRNLGVGR